MIPRSQVADIRTALPFWISLAVVPLVLLAAAYGGWALLLPAVGAWWMFAILDAVTGRYRENPDLATEEAELWWYRLITLVWFPVQFVLVFGMIWWASGTETLAGWEKVGLFLGLGIVSGTIGIVYAHELLHQRNRLERWLGDLLLASVLYSHFRTEHLLVHHRHVGTPRDAVTARYNEGFHRFFLRVLLECPPSAFRAEQAMLARRGREWWHPSNPFWRYLLLQLAILLLAFALGGWTGIGLFLVQAFTAIWQLELVNYMEHYGLTRKHLGNGKYEHVLPRHSWNADHRASNWLLINLQRHSDHHYKPDRRFPLLQTYDAGEAPQLPFGYPVMSFAALVPPVWRRVMNPKVREWRRRNYPEIEDWKPYNKGLNPAPA